MFFPMRVLIVEACKELAENLVEVLDSFGYRADQAGSGAQALQQVASHRYDCIVLNALLPDTDGADLIQELRMADHSLRFVVMAALLGDRMTERVEAAGASSVVSTLDSARLVSDLARELRPGRPAGAVRSRSYGWLGRRRAPNVLR